MIYAHTGNYRPWLDECHLPSGGYIARIVVPYCANSCPAGKHLKSMYCTTMALRSLSLVVSYLRHSYVEIVGQLSTGSMSQKTSTAGVLSQWWSGVTLALKPC